MAKKETPIRFAEETPPANVTNPESPKPADDKKHEQKTQPAQPAETEAAGS